MWNYILGGCLVLAIIWGLYEIFEHQIIQYTKTEIPERKGTKGDFLKVCMISDLHNNKKWRKERIFQKISDFQPDLILLCGDMVNKHADDNANAIEFIDELCKIGEVYYSFGNHESVLEKRNKSLWEKYTQSLPTACKILDNQTISLCAKHYSGDLYVSGLSLPLDYYKKGKLLKETFYPASFAVEVKQDDTWDKFHILMAHHPEYAKMYREFQPDLTLSGHLHGGLLRLPFVGGILAPRYAFPNWDAGLYMIDGLRLFVSRGLGSHTLPLRFFNRTELNFLTITFGNKE